MKMEDGSAKAVDEALKLLNKAKITRSFVRSSDGQKIIQGVQEEVSLLLREITDKQLSHIDYIEKRGQVAILRKQLNTWQTDAENVDRYQEMYEQRSRENAERIKYESETA